MLNNFLPRFLLAVCVVTVFPGANRANATTPLTQAEIQELRNIVQLIPKNNTQARPARRLDTITPGDGVSTGRSSLADLRFNDGSVARVGEQAVFQFLPQTRNFTLSNGTVLLLIPPGRGQTRIKTPNAAAAIRGSALFVRYNKESDTTIIGALTNSGIEVANQEASQRLVLEAGQLMVVVKGEFQGLYDFDLRNFYEQSNLVRGLDLTRQNSTPTADPALASVQAETAAAVAAQKPILGQGTIDNPSFLNKNINALGSSNRSNNNSNNRDSGRQQTSTNRPPRDNLGRGSAAGNPRGPIDSVVRTGEVIRENREVNNPGQGGGNSGGGNSGGGNSGGGNSGGGNSGGGNSGGGNSGGGNPNQGNQGGGNSGGGNPGGGNSGGGNPGGGNSGGGNPGGGNSGGGNPGGGNSGGGNPGGGNSGGGNPGQGNQGGGNPGQGNN